MGNGYGKFTVSFKRKLLIAHRASYILFNEAIPEGLHVLHKCDTPLCVNPAHLFLGTHQENMADMKHKKRAKAWKGEENSGAKLNETQVLNIRASNLSNAHLAQQYDVHRDTISRIKLRKNWKCI